jgi:hypothetical protein
VSRKDVVAFIFTMLALWAMAVLIAWLGVRALDTEAEQPIRSTMYR